MRHGNHQGGFRHAVAGIETVTIKTTGSKCFTKLVNRILSHLLGTCENQLAASKIQCGFLRRRYLAGTELKGKVGTTRMRYPIARNDI